MYVYTYTNAYNLIAVMLELKRESKVIIALMVLCPTLITWQPIETT